MSRNFAAFVAPLQTLLLDANIAEIPNPEICAPDFRAKLAGPIGDIEGCA